MNLSEVVRFVSTYKCEHIFVIIISTYVAISPPLVTLKVFHIPLLAR